jgi:hypothetical protein
MTRRALSIAVAILLAAAVGMVAATKLLFRGSRGPTCPVAGLIAVEHDGRWAVDAEPGNYMSFYEPWDSGLYDT